MFLVQCVNINNHTVLLESICGLLSSSSLEEELKAVLCAMAHLSSYPRARVLGKGAESWP